MSHHHVNSHCATHPTIFFTFEGNSGAALSLSVSCTKVRGRGTGTPKDTVRRLLLARQRLHESASCLCKKPLLSARGTLQDMHGRNQLKDDQSRPCALGKQKTNHLYKYQRCGVWSYTWSEWHESLRKKVECFFGRLKKKYRCLAVEVKFTDMAVVDKMFKVCCCLDVMVRKDRGDFDDELGWRQLDDEEMSKVFDDDGRWLARYRRREWNDELVAPPAGPEDPAEDDVDVAPAPFEVLESGRALRDALVHHFKRFKAHLRAIRPPQHAPLRRLNIH